MFSKNCFLGSQFLCLVKIASIFMFRKIASLEVLGSQYGIFKYLNLNTYTTYQRVI